MQAGPKMTMEIPLQREFDRRGGSPGGEQNQELDQMRKKGKRLSERLIIKSKRWETLNEAD